MKKNYRKPTSLAVLLDNCTVIAESLTVNTGSGTPEIENPDEILTKEITTKSLWDNEW